MNMGSVMIEFDHDTAFSFFIHMWYYYGVYELEGVYMINGLVFFDYDGTLVDEREGIYVPTDRTKEVVKELQKKNYLCLLATGRALSYVPKGAMELGLDGYITCNGAYIELHDQLVYKKPVEENVLQTLLECFHNEQVNFILESNEICLVKDMEDPEYLHFMEYFHVPWDNYKEYQGDVNINIYKITVVCKDEEQLNRMQALLQDDFACSFHRNCLTFDIGDKEIHKGSGIDRVMEYCQVPRLNTYAFGDGDNDVELLRNAGQGIAMTPHHIALTDVYDMKTTSVKDEGIAFALKYYGLID